MGNLEFTNKQKLLNPAHIQIKLATLKPILFQTYPLSYLAFAAKNEEGNFGKWTEVYVMVDFKEAIGWQFYALQAELMNHLQTEITLITKTSPDRGWLHQNTKVCEIV